MRAAILNTMSEHERERECWWLTGGDEGRTTLRDERPPFGLHSDSLRSRHDTSSVPFTVLPN